MSFSPDPIAPDLRELLPQHEAGEHEVDDRPVYYLWTFDPEGNGKIYIDHNEDRHPADALTHQTLAPHVTHPETVHGYAYSIKGGWRITDNHHNQVKGPEGAYIVRRVEQALRGEHPEPPLPSIRYHRI
jgi:hypothetical protein